MAVWAIAHHDTALTILRPGSTMIRVPLPSADGPASRILIVDDDVSVTDTFSRMLRLEGYEVWAALSADEGLTLAQAHRPHAVILDLRMPLTSGLQFLRAIRAIPGGVFSADSARIAYWTDSSGSAALHVLELPSTDTVVSTFPNLRGG